MSNGNQPKPCKRPGCKFPRIVSIQRGGKSRRRQTCSPECRIWLLRATRAVRDNDAAEAAEVMRLSVALDGRTSPTERVQDVFTQ
ncbi:hypothetical protein SAMN04490357_1747 [Streptomyces misionensis]|uniref:Uncharacterized protein n=1 Tax=Streptomyces misionensis TaxID=67331 RepID=A0A1H4RNI4_9ACTN|nr:hypothetical protein SAMN04490357_1747 [Streptomyces misionensis]